MLNSIIYTGTEGEEAGHGVRVCPGVLSLCGTAGATVGAGRRWRHQGTGHHRQWRGGGRHAAGPRILKVGARMNVGPLHHHLREGA